MPRRKSPTADDISRVMSMLGTRGAKAGHQRKTAAQRKAHAQALARARWAKAKVIGL